MADGIRRWWCCVFLLAVLGAGAQVHTRETRAGCGLGVPVLGFPLDHPGGGLARAMPHTRLPLCLTPASGTRANGRHLKSRKLSYPGMKRRPHMRSKEEAVGREHGAERDPAVEGRGEGRQGPGRRVG